ncbi:endo alpha-1,4 polygalactosaminidase [Flavobacterium sp.]|uniref:endo alpha-1,4 polygalactosaminidase n=1 Tax=Flavobacterium sp. TaxID=239 RepID=UPI0028BD57AA|nr:endo alpha-1,4 polygalactosaminidase [Flavobacterium sp.]
MRHIKLFFLLFPSLFGIESSGANVVQSDVFFCYGKLNPLDVKGYSYVVLESKNYAIPDVKKFKKLNGKVLAYISLGEVNSQAKYYNKLKDSVLGKNENWDSYYLNLKRNETKETLFSIIDEILADGYDGLFLDNIDNFCTFGFQASQKEELIQFISDLNTKYPNHIFIQNAGLEIIDKTSDFVDALVVESVASNFTFDDKKYKLRLQSEYDSYIRRLHQIRRKHKLTLILVEYADTKTLHDEIVKRIQRTGFMYFIGSIDLQGFPQFSE